MVDGNGWAKSRTKPVRFKFGAREVAPAWKKGQDSPSRTEEEEEEEAEEEEEEEEEKGRNHHLRREERLKTRQVRPHRNDGCDP